MATFASIAKGHRARKPVPFPLSGAKWNTTSAAWDGETVLIDVRVLTPGEELEAITAAAAYARGKGIPEPGEGDPIYDYALSVEKIVRACVDPESPKDAPVCFFASFDEVLNDEAITREHVAYLVEQQALWQDECSPRPNTMSATDFEANVVRVAAGDAQSFLGWSLAMRWSFVRSTALLAASSLVAKSSSGSASATT